MNEYMEKAKDFERSIADLFELMGWHVERNVILSTHEIDILAKQNLGLLSLRVAIECKYTDKPLTNAHIQQFASSASLLKNRGVVDKAIIVSHSGFTASAKDSAQRYGIECFSYDDIISKLIDFTPYLRSVVDSFERNTIVEQFIEPSLLDQDKQSHNAISYLNKWLVHDNQPHLSILGDAGSGKTTLCKNFAYHIAKENILHESISRIPIFISLNKFRKSSNIKQLVIDTLVNEHGMSLPSFNILRRVMDQGKILLIFDGFDEMSLRSDSSTVIENFWELAEFAKSKNKVLLTCRTHYFHSELEETDILKGYENEITKQISSRPTFEVVYLKNWNNDQIVEYLKRIVGNKWEINFKTLKNTYNLLDLASNPSLLDMIVKTLNLKDALSFKKSDLYRAYIDANLDRESMVRSNLYPKKMILDFFKKLAWQLYSKDKFIIKYVELEDAVEEYLNSNEYESEGQIKFLSTISTFALMNRDFSGNYQFAHRSFLEYFVAEFIADNPKIDLKSINISNEVESYLKEILLRKGEKKIGNESNK